MIIMWLLCDYKLDVVFSSLSFKHNIVRKMADNTELTEELLDYEEDEQQAPAADDNAAGDVKKPKGLSYWKHLM